jgi:hypothetical protein
MTGLRKADFVDADIIDASELGSTGSAVFVSDVTVVSTAAATKTITISGTDVIYDKDDRLEAGDLITLTGTSGGAADGTYTVNEIPSSTTFTVNEVIADSTGGTADFKHPPGASRVGCDPATIELTSATDVQGALEDLSAAVLPSNDHDGLDTLTHRINESGYEEYTYTNQKLTNYTFWTDSNKTKKIREEQFTYTGNFITGWVEIQYDTDGNEKERNTMSNFDYTGSFINHNDRTHS